MSSVFAGSSSKPGVVVRKALDVAPQRIARLGEVAERALQLRDLLQHIGHAGVDGVHLLERCDGFGALILDRLHRVQVLQSQEVLGVELRPHLDDSPRFVDVLRDCIVVRFDDELCTFR
jgi:hypothetical protein